MKPHARPVYLDLLRIHLPLAGWVSILHRLSGALLFLALPLGIGALSLSLSSEEGFQQMRVWLASVPARLLLVVLAWAFSHHWLAGLRHLALDLDAGTGRAAARRSSAAVLALSGLFTLIVAWSVFR